MVKHSLRITIIFFSVLLLIFSFSFFAFNQIFKDKVYYGVYADSYNVSGFSKDNIQQSLHMTDSQLQNLTITIKSDNYVATVSGQNLERKYNSNLTADQSMLIARSGSFASDLRFRLHSYYLWITKSSKRLITVPLEIMYTAEPIDEALANASDVIDSEPVEPLFDFNPDSKKVTLFRLGNNGRKVETNKAKESIDKAIENPDLSEFTYQLPVEIIPPVTQSSKPELFGISALIGKGESFFKGSIPGRIHNIALASSRIHGTMIPPGETFSFNATLGDVSAATGYQSAYIIQDGKTILGDGGGVCQVSTTLFRAALNTGLPIVERHPHSYRVGYYEQGGLKPGLDASVFAPSADFKFTNNTDNNILIQADFDKANTKLSFLLYGTPDNRMVSLGDITFLSQTPPPEPLYQEDPTLAPGVINQIEHAAWGAKTTYTYKVTRGDELLIDKTFTSVYRPWRAVYLKGPGT
jgi:vancomycin resistance protein YoaR